MNHRVTNAWLLVLLSLYLASCSGEPGPERVAAHGSVRLGGVPLAAGQIRFIPEAETTGPAAAAPIRNGEYAFDESDGPVVGTHRIEIEATDYLEFPIDDEQAFASFAESGGTRDRQRTQNPVPRKFNRNSQMTRTIETDTEPRFDFDLTPDAPQKPR